MIQDFRYGIRTLLKRPGFTLITILTLALGIGATTAVFSLIQGVLLSPPPYQHPEQLVLIPSARADGQEMSGARAWPAAQWQDWQKQAKSFEGIAAYAWTFNFLIRTDGSESMEGMVVSPGYFKVAGLEPILGRTFLDTEGGPNSNSVIILGYDFWQRVFNGDRNIVGSTLRMSRRETPLTIVGVMPSGVRFLPSPAVVQEPNYDVNATVDFWMPVIPNPAGLKQARWDVMGRLRAGVAITEAQSELSVLAMQEAQAEPDFQGFIPNLTPLAADMNRDGKRILYPLLGAALLVFLIACGNAAALMLVRGLQRHQEYAVRSALGIGRVALFRQVSAESLLLALAGGTAGAALAIGLVAMFKLVGGHAVPRLDAVTIGWPMFVWGFGAALVAALLAGLFPAMRASRFDAVDALKSAGPNSSAGRGERTLLRSVTMIQTALTLALLVGAGLLIRTMSNISRVESGYNTSRVLTMSVTYFQSDPANRNGYSDFHHRALERVSALPGVESAAFVWGVPLTGNNWQNPIEIEGQPAPTKASERTILPIRSVTPGYFSLLRLRMQEGRDFRDSDNGTSQPVAIINQALAERYFPKETPIAKKMWTRGRQNPPAEIIGVVANSRTDDLTQNAEPEVYVSLWQNGAFSKHLAVRSASDPRSVMQAVRAELHSVDPTAAVENIKTLDDIRADSLASRSFAMQLLTGFSFIGSVLTLVGIYGVLSLSVAARRRELAIRSAVGAEHKDIRNLVLGEGLRLVAGGILLGLGAALLLSRVLRAFLFGVEPTDPFTLISAGLLFTGVALLACWVPMRRAAKVNPLEALRYE
jgi:putative ABC transport system permease protein